MSKQKTEQTAPGQCGHAEASQKATIDYLIHDVFQNHPIVSSDCLSAVVTIVFWLIQKFVRRK